MSHHTAQEIRVINHWTVASLQREVKQFSPVSAVQACAGYFVISVLNAEIITFVGTLCFISHKISTCHITCYMVSGVYCTNSEILKQKDTFILITINRTISVLKQSQ